MQSDLRFLMESLKNWNYKAKPQETLSFKGDYYDKTETCYVLSSSSLQPTIQKWDEN